MTVQNILEFLESLAPASMKYDWDNVGLLCGSRTKEVRKVLVALDPFENVCREAVELGADLLVTHHPLIFRAPRAVTDDDGVGRSILLLAQHGISAVNIHTNYDCAPGGVNDILAKTLGLTDVEVLEPLGTDEQGSAYGLLRAGFVPRQSLEQFLSHVKETLQTPGLRYADGGREVQRVAVGGGACGDDIPAAVAAGCDTFVTADVKYNQFRDAVDLGVNIIDAGHFATENPAMAPLAEKLQARFPELTVELSRCHRDCVCYF